MDLNRLDLNLLVLFDSLYKYRSVRLASEHMCISPSAFSHGLARLRQSLDDELFVRVRNEMLPTEKADLLAAKVSSALALIREGLASSENFDPAHSDKEFVFAATDYTGLALMPLLMAYLTRMAPNIRIKLVQTSQKVPVPELESGEINFALGFTHNPEAASLILSQPWLTDSYCCLARKDHPDLMGELSLDNFLQQSHILVSPWNETLGIVDQSLGKMGLKRRVGLRVPSVLVAPYIVAETDMLVTIPKRVATKMIEHLPLSLYEVPFQIPDYQLKLYWHKLKSAQPSYRWMKQALFDALRNRAL